MNDRLNLEGKTSGENIREQIHNLEAESDILKSIQKTITIKFKI